MNLIIDLSILIHANYHIITKFAKTVSAVGLADKIINQVDNLVITLQKDGYTITNVVCVGDTKSNFRKAIYEGYKAHRAKRKELNKIKYQVLDLVSSKLDLITYKGLEADDIIYLYTKKYKPCIVVTNDRDLLQCVSDTTKVYLYQKQEMVEPGEVTTEPNYIVLSKCLTGDVSDNIKRSVTNARVLKKAILRAYNSIKVFDTKSIIKACKKEGIDVNKKLFKINRELIELNVETYEKYIPKFSKFYKKL